MIEPTLEKRATRSDLIKAGSLALRPSAERVLTFDEVLEARFPQPRFRRILFIAPKPHGWQVPQAPSPTFGYLGEMLGRHGFEWMLLDLRLGGGLKEVEKAIAQFRPDVLGYSFQFTVGAAHCVRFLHDIRGITDLPILIGGSHLVIRGHNILEDVPPVMAAVRREGEFPLLAIMKGVPLRQVPNLWFLEDGDVVETPDAPYLADLDRIPWPRYSGYDLSRFANVGQIDILTSRGCPYGCSFCSVKLTQGRGYRMRSVESVVEEIRHWYGLGIREFNFHDDILTVNRERFMRLLDLIEKAGLEDVNLYCTQGMRADVCDAEMLGKMKEVGFRFLAFGVESASDRILKIINKGETLEAIDRAIELSCRLGFDVGLFFIIGLPTETVEDVEASFRFAVKHPVRMVNFHTCIPYPGTEIARWVDENSDWYVNPAEYLTNFSYYDESIVFDNRGMSREDHQRMMEKSTTVAARVRIRYTRERLVKRGVPGPLSQAVAFALYNRHTLQLFRRLDKTKLGATLKKAVVTGLNLQEKA